MNSLRDILILVFLLGSSAIGYASHPTNTQTGEYNGKHSESGLDLILKAVHNPESTGNGQNSQSYDQNIESRKQRDYGSFQNSGYLYSKGEYTPNHQHNQGTSNYNNNGYQYTPSNNGAGYRYENPSVTQNVGGLDYGSNYLDNNKNTYYSGQQSSNSGYQYEVPAQNYYGNFQPASTEMGYNYGKPKYTSSTSSNFKEEPYLPQALTSSHNGYQYEQNQGLHATSVNGYQYESSKNSGYNYYKPQQFGQTVSSFKGQSYLPKPTTSFSSYPKDSSSQGYSYEKPSAVFKGDSYLPQPTTTISNGW